MENDLKDSIKKIEEIKKRQEKIEKVIIIVAGIFAVLIFLVIGVNIYYSGGDEPVSQPEVVLEDKVQINVLEYKSENQITTATALQNPQEKQQEIKDTKKDKKQEKPDKSLNTKEQTQDKTLEQERKQKEKHQNTLKTVEKTKKQKQETEPVKPVKTKQFYYTVQVGAFASKKRAIEYLNSLKLKGKVVEKNGIHRVLIGEFDSYKEAYKFMKKHSLKGFVRKVKN